MTHSAFLNRKEGPLKRLEIVVRLLQGRGQQQSESAVKAAFDTADRIIRLDDPAKSKTIEEHLGRAAALSDELDSARGTISDLEKDVARLQGELATAEKPDVDSALNKRAADLEVKLEQAEAEITSLGSANNDLQAENDRLRKEVADLSADPEDEETSGE